MPWVMRNVEGKIITFFPTNRGGNLEWVGQDDPAIIDFLSGHAPPTTIPFTQLWGRLPEQARGAILSAASQGNAQMLGWLILGAAAGSVDLTDPQVSAGMDQLVAGEFITEQQKTEILTP